ncbi:hypothetical protein FA15DRAFT_667490 [Coprinopsis marcescibilis]|uniref:Uncharacterized protein n=1 Tax=Coprinopsis marcescibilis TaxID=230819 RepID=A0A5C3L160_COPMA|nr:hypothetical protein FA15DRAFT_667490 [Coprinopsis marcescibilis]
MHTLNITNLGTENALWLDYLLVELPTTSRNKIVTRTETVTIPCSIPSSTNGRARGEGSPSSLDRGVSSTVIAAGAGLIGIALLAIAGFVIFLTRRRKRRRREARESSIQPFDSTASEYEFCSATGFF